MRLDNMRHLLRLNAQLWSGMPLGLQAHGTGNWRSGATASAAAENVAQKALRQGIPSDLVPFGISPAEAASRFDSFQLKACTGMQAHNLLKGSKDTITSVTATYVPYWAFTVKVNTHFKVVAASPSAGAAQDVPKQEWQSFLKDEEITPERSPEMLVYASFSHTRTLLGQGGELCGSSSLASLSRRPLTDSEAAGMTASTPPCELTDLQATSSDTPSSRPYDVPVSASMQLPDMKQGVAWQFVWRNLMKNQIAEARRKLGLDDAVGTDVFVKIQVLERRARLLYLPVYIMKYQHGTRYKQGTSGVILPQIFQAAVGGTKNGTVMAHPHFSPLKAQLLAGSVVGGSALLFTEHALPLFGIAPPVLLVGAVEVCCVAVIAAAYAGLWARGWQQREINRVALKQARADGEFYRQYDMREAKTVEKSAEAEEFASVASKDEDSDAFMQWLWMDLDWRRWECEDELTWDPKLQKSAAEELWRQQQRRRVERLRYVERMESARYLLHSEAEVESRRQRQHHAGQRGGQHAGRNALSRHQGRRDFLGYYKILGVEAGPHDVISTDVIKAAFKTRAMQLHPDKMGDADEETKSYAHVQFQKLQMAYDVLKDEEKRRSYDRGRLVEH